MKKFAFLLGITVSLLGTHSIQAQFDSSINIVTTAVPFLRISPDARSGAMGDMGISSAPDANAPFWNLAKTTFAKKRSAVTFNYTPWLRDLGLTDVYLASAAAYHQLDEDQAIGGSLRFFSLGNIQLTDFSGNILNNVRPAEFAIDAGYARKLNDQFSVGVAMRYINSRLVVGDVGGVIYKAGNAIAGDVSLFYDGTEGGNAQGLNAGLTLSNLGTKIGYTNDATNRDFIPANIGLGLSYNLVLDGANLLTLGVDVNKLLVPAPPIRTGNFSVDSARLAEYRNTSVVSSWMKSFSDGSGEFKDLTFSLGAEYAYNDQFFFRAGYFYEDRTRGNRKFFSAGAGFKTNGIGINLSYIVPSGSGVNRNPLSNTLRFGVLFDFGGE